MYYYGNRNILAIQGASELREHDRKCFFSPNFRADNPLKSGYQILPCFPRMHNLFMQFQTLQNVVIFVNFFYKKGCCQNFLPNFNFFNFKNCFLFSELLKRLSANLIRPLELLLLRRKVKQGYTQPRSPPNIPRHPKKIPQPFHRLCSEVIQNNVVI